MHLWSSVHYSSLPHFTALIMCENVYIRILEDTCRLIEFTVVTPFYLALFLKCIKEKCNLDFKYSSICCNPLFNFRPQEFLRNFCVIDMWWSAQRDGVHSFSHMHLYALQYFRNSQSPGVVFVLIIPLAYIWLILLNPLENPLEIWFNLYLAEIFHYYSNL